MLRLLIAILLGLITPAYGQPSAPASEQALGNKLLVEIQAGLQCSSGLIQAQQEITRLKAELEKLKAEPKK